MCWKWVGQGDATHLCESTPLEHIYENWCGNQEWWMIECVFSLNDKMSSICPGVSQIYTPHSPDHHTYPLISVHHSVTQSVSNFPVSPYRPMPGSPCQPSTGSEKCISHHTVHYCSSGYKIFTSLVSIDSLSSSITTCQSSTSQIPFILLYPALSWDYKQCTADITASTRWMRWWGINHMVTLNSLHKSDGSGGMEWTVRDIPKSWNYRD